MRAQLEAGEATIEALQRDLCGQREVLFPFQTLNPKPWTVHPKIGTLNALTKPVWTKQELMDC